MSGYRSDFWVFVGTSVKFFGTLRPCSLRVFNFILTRKYGYFLQIQISGCKDLLISSVRGLLVQTSVLFIFCFTFSWLVNKYKKTHYRLDVNISQLRAYIKPQINEKPMDPDSRKSIHTKYGFLDLHKVVYKRSKDQIRCLKTQWYSSQFFSLKLSEEDGGHKMFYKLKVFKGTGLKSFALPCCYPNGRGNSTS